MARKNKYRVKYVMQGWGSFPASNTLDVEAVDRKSAIEVAIQTAFHTPSLKVNWRFDFEVEKKLKPDHPMTRTIFGLTTRRVPDPSHVIKLNEVWNTGVVRGLGGVLFVCVDTNDLHKPLVKPWPNTEFRDWLRQSCRYFLALDDAEVLADRAEEAGLSDVADLVRHEVKKMRALRVER